MLKLELKIPPVLLMVIVAIFMWLTSFFFPKTTVFKEYELMIAISLIGTGLFFFAFGGLSFIKEKTTVNPTTPNAVSSLVTSGIYRITRNPMYVGCVFVLIAFGVFLSCLYTLFLAVGFVLYMNKFQILPEEKALEYLFGTEFISYKSRVRRWL